MASTVDEIGLLVEACDRISELIHSRDLAAPIPRLGRWKVRDVVAHLGGVHRWATRIVVSRSNDGPGFTKSKLGGTELCDWFDEGATALVEALRTNDAADACPNFNPGSSKTVGWWVRRQLHETTVHRWDIERALECATAIDAGVAVDGVDEFLDVFVRTRGKQTLTSPLLLTTTKPARSWTLTPAQKPGRIDIAVGRQVEAATELCGPPADLLLALWNRLTLAETRLSVTGDENVAASLITL